MQFKNDRIAMAVLTFMTLMFMLGVGTGLLISAEPAGHADVAGEWTLSIFDPLSINDQVPFVLEQDGTTLTGTARESIVTGTVDGDRVAFRYEVDTFQVGRITLAFTGTVTNDGSMRGDVAFGRYGAGTWTADR